MTDRKIGPPAKVSLREITSETVREVCRLRDTLSEQQKKMDALTAVSIAQAHVHDRAWFRGVYADDAPVGFVMLYDDPKNKETATDVGRWNSCSTTCDSGWGTRNLERASSRWREVPRGSTRSFASSRPVRFVTAKS
jgi:hypothetical protein